MASVPSVPAGCNLRWNVDDAATVLSLTETMIAKSRATLDSVAAVTAPESATWETVMKPLADDETETRASSAVLEFLQHVSAVKELRDASTNADKMIAEFGVECEMRVDVYNAVQTFANTEEAKALGGEQARFLERILRDFKRNGLHLGEENREKIKEIKEKMSKVPCHHHLLASILSPRHNPLPQTEPSFCACARRSSRSTSARTVTMKTRSLV